MAEAARLRHRAGPTARDFPLSLSAVWNLDLGARVRSRPQQQQLGPRGRCTMASGVQSLNCAGPGMAS
eukprot:13539413-Alexandrium_andersonii.AAC.1